MSVHRSVRVECDRCSKFGDEAGTLKEVRAHLRREGWYMKYGVDLCPRCSGREEKPKARRKER